MPPTDIPAIPPALGEGYQTTDFAMHCPVCGRLVMGYYLRPKDEEGMTVIIASELHDVMCEHYSSEAL